MIGIDGSQCARTVEESINGDLVLVNDVLSVAGCFPTAPTSWCLCCCHFGGSSNNSGTTKTTSHKTLNAD